MLTFYSDSHLQRDSRTELYGGELVRPHERPSRAAYILQRVNDVGLGDVHEPGEFGLEPVYKVHDRGFVEFLRTAWEDWQQVGCSSAMDC